MDKFEVEIVLDGKLDDSIHEQITNNMKYVKWKFSRENDERYCVIVMTEAETYQEAISQAVIEVEKLLSVYFLYSHESIGISHGTQVETRNLSNDKRVVAGISAYLVGEPFNLSTFDELKSNYLKLVNGENNNFLRIALDYFRLGRMEDYLANRLIDYFVSLEALYSFGEKTEMRYRISNRIATLLGENLEHRKEILKKARFFYDQRSAIVHGSEHQLSTNEQGTIYQWVRESILRFMVLLPIYSSHEKIIEQIDLAMIDNEVRDELRNKSKILFEKILDFK